MLATVQQLGAPPCPPEDRLVDLSRGVAGDDAEALREHLDECASCRIAVARLLASAPVADRCGTLVAGRYRLGRALGKGGMGEVHEAWDETLERRVAVKTIGARTGVASIDGEQDVARLVRESKAMARVRHPNVVTVFDAGSWEGRAFVVMELVEGHTLRSWRAHAPRGWREILAMYTAAAHGLQAAHARGIVHRDFKPDNVLVDQAGRAQVTDFGLARWSSDDAPTAASSLPADAWVFDESGSITQTGAAVGTPPYMAPEQFRGDAHVGVDVFAFCVALFEALAGRRPFEGRDLRALVQAQRRGASEDALRVADVPRWLRAAVLAGLAFRPEDRPADMAALLARLQPPRSPSRRLAIVTGVVACGGLGWMLAVPDDPCATDPLADKWTSARRAAIAERDGASSAFVDAGLDPWADGYRGAWSEVCAREQSGDALRRACLLGHRATFGAIVDGLANGDLDVVAATKGLPSLASCADADALEQRMPEPGDPALVADVNAVRVELEELRGRQAIEPAWPLEARCVAALDRARAIGYRPLEAEAMIVLANNVAVTGDPQAAHEMFVAAAQLATASGHDAAAALAWTHLVELATRHLWDLSRAAEYAANAEAAIERLGPSSETESRRLDLHFVRGLLALQTGDLERARQELARSAELAESIAPGEVPPALEGQALVLESAGDLAGALAIHEQLAALRRARGGEQHPELFFSYMNIASTHVMMGNPELALAAARTATALALGSRGPDHPDYGLVLHNEGELLRTFGRYEEALERFERAQRLFTSTLGDENPYVASTMVHRGGVLQGLGRLDEALVEMRGALDRFGRRGMTFDVATTRMNIADVLREKGTFDEALAQIDAALEVLEPEATDAESSMVPELAYGLSVKGELLLDLGRAAEALAVLQRSRERFAAGFLPNEAAIADFATARALVATGGDRAEARALAMHAESVWKVAPASWRSRHAAVTRWLAEAAL
jgi:serine/threonine protein kinase/tetratricopeptide (TPR) repeat protein